MIQFNVRGLPPGVRAFLNNPVISQEARYADGGGFINFYSADTGFSPAQQTDLLIDGAGYAPYSYFAATGKVLSLGTTTVEVTDVELTPSFKVPGRDRLCAVRALFQGQAVDYNGVTVPMFGPFCYSFDRAGRQRWRTAEHTVNLIPGVPVTHCIRALSYNYPVYSGYGIPGNDFTQDLVGLKQLLAEDLLAGMYPVLYLAGDGQSYTPVGGTYGYSWLMQNMARIFAALNDPSVCGFSMEKVGLTCLGFELITNGGWTPGNFETATLEQRRCAGPNAVIASHIGTYTWWGDNDPHHSLGPVGDWASPAGQAIDVCFEEGDTPFLYSNPPTAQEIDYDNGWQQRAWAHLGPHVATNIRPDNQIQYEWPQPPAQQTPRGPRTSVALEIDEYRWTHNETTIEVITAERQKIASYGFTLIS